MSDLIHELQPYLFRGRIIVPDGVYPFSKYFSRLDASLKTPPRLFPSYPEKLHWMTLDSLQHHVMLETPGENFIRYNCAPSSWFFKNSAIDTDQVDMLIPLYPSPKWVKGGEGQATLTIGSVTVPDADHYVFSFLVNDSMTETLTVKTPDAQFVFELENNEVFFDQGSKAGILPDYYSRGEKETRRCWMTIKKGSGSYQLIITTPQAQSVTDDGLWVTGFQVERGEYPGRLTITHRGERPRWGEPDMLELPSISQGASLFVYVFPLSDWFGEKECLLLTEATDIPQSKWVDITKTDNNWKITPKETCSVRVSHYNWTSNADERTFIMNRGF